MNAFERAAWAVLIFGTVVFVGLAVLAWWLDRRRKAAARRVYEERMATLTEDYRRAAMAIGIALMPAAADIVATMNGIARAFEHAADRLGTDVPGLMAMLEPTEDEDQDEGE